MVDLGTYIFKELNTGEIPPEYFLLMLTSKEYMSQSIYILLQYLVRVILYAKYNKVNLNKVMENQCQHLTMTHRNELLKLLQKF